LATGVALYLLGMLTWSVFGGGVSDSPAGEPLRFVIPDLSTSPLGRTLAISRDGALVAHANAGSFSVRPVLDFANSSELATNGLQPFFSPDGQSIGYFAGINQSLLTIPIEGGTPTLVVEGTGARALGGSWGGDGTIVFATTSGLYRVPEEGGEPELLRAPDGQRGELYFSWPAMLPGDDAVLFTIIPETGESDEDGSIACMNLGSRELTVVMTGGSGARYSSTGHILYTARGGTLFAVAFDGRCGAINRERVELPITGLALPARDRGFGADFDISSDGTLVYSLANEQPATLEWIDRAGRREPLPAPPRRYGYLRVSPDGTQIATDVRSLVGRDIYLRDNVRGTDLRLTNDPGEEFFAEWSLGGDSLYYSSNEGGGTFDVYRRAADGTGQSELVMAREAPQMLNDLTPDGRLLVAEGRPSGDVFDLMMLTLQEPVRVDTLLSTPSREMNASASPDGRFVAYESNATGQSEVYVSPTTDAARVRWKVSIDGGERPLWSTSGDTIFYRSRADSMMAASVRRTPTFAVQGVVPLFLMGSGSSFGVTGGAWLGSLAARRSVLACEAPASGAERGPRRPELDAGTTSPHGILGARGIARVPILLRHIPSRSRLCGRRHGMS
jgi:Tol biopolymer transport system component